MELVEGMRTDPDCEEECGQRRQEPGKPEVRSKGGSDRHVAQMPGRVGRVKERRVVAPASGGERVEGGPRRFSGHGSPRPRSRRPG